MPVKHLKKIIKYFTFGLGLMVFFTKNAHAYLDPGTGSYLFQLIIASLLGGLFALKTWWRSIIAFFKRPKSPEKVNTAAQEDDHPKK